MSGSGSTVFPSVVGRSPLGEDVHVPGDLPEESTLVVVAVRQRPQTCVDRWIALAVAAG